MVTYLRDFSFDYYSKIYKTTADDGALLARLYERQGSIVS